MLVITHVHRHSENDSWENGCDGPGEIDWPEWEGAFKTKKDLIEYILDTTECKEDTLDFNACEEIGRVDVQYSATDHQRPPATKGEIAKWKDGKISMRAITVSFYIVETKPFDFTLNED